MYVVKPQRKNVTCMFTSCFHIPLPSPSHTPIPPLFLALIVYSFFFLTVELYQKFY